MAFIIIIQKQIQYQIMEQVFKKLIYIITTLIISYLLAWGTVFVYYDFSYRIFPIFIFLSTLSKAFFIINIILLIVLSFFLFKKYIGKMIYVFTIILLISITLLIYFVFKDFLKY